MLKKWLRGISVVGIMAMAAGAQAAEISLDQYLQEMEQGSAAYAAAQKGEAAAQAKLKERDLLTSPYLFADGQIASDHSESLEPYYYGTSRRQDQLSVGLEQQTAFGLNWRLLHQTVRNSVTGADPTLMPLDHYFTTKTGLEISQDLWRNAFGREVLASATAMEAQTQAESLGYQYQLRQLRVEAEKLYWQLSLARDAVRIQQELLDRAVRLANWVQGRTALKLQDKSDLMQAQAQVEMRRLELSASQDQEKMAGRAFNLFRGQNSEVVAETLALPTEAHLTAGGLPGEPPLRQDVKALEWNQIAARQGASRKQDNLMPQLQARVAGYMNGLDQEFDPAFSDSQKTEFATVVAGVVLRVPLDYFSRQPLSAGYETESHSVDKILEARRLEAQTEWQEIKRQLQENQNRLAIARRLEDLQKQKVEHERIRLQRGNSITFQVLQFEQDWGGSQLARISIEANILELLARTKLYGE